MEQFLESPRSSMVLFPTGILPSQVAKSKEATSQKENQPRRFSQMRPNCKIRPPCLMDSNGQHSST